MSLARVVSGRRAAGLVVSLGLAGAFATAAAPAASAQTATDLNADLTASGPDAVLPGATATYTATVTNPLPTTTTGVELVAIAPLGMTLLSSNNCPAFRFGGGSLRNELSCNTTNLAPGASESVTFTLSVPTSAAPDTFQFEFGLSFDEGGSPVVSGGEVLLPVTVQPAPTDLQVTGSSNNGGPAVGSPFTYTFQVKDNGPAAASGVSFDDTLPASIAPAGTPTITGGGSCTAAASSVHCVADALGVGQQVTIAIPAEATATGSFANTATVAMAGTDSRPANNSVTVTVQPR